MTPDEARAAWIAESVRLAEVMGDPVPTGESLGADWNELAKGRRAAYQSELAHGALTARRIAETGLHDDAATDDE